MKKNIFIFSICYGLLACGGSSSEEKKSENKIDSTLSFLGDTISGDDAVDASQVSTQLIGKDSVAIKLSGKINSVCQKKGCWMEVEIAKDKSMRVTFKDYAFFVPKDVSGKTAIIEGYAYNDTISIEELKHYAEDAGESKEEIAKIVSPEVEISFEARGVIIKNE